MGNIQWKAFFCITSWHCPVFGFCARQSPSLPPFFIAPTSFSNKFQLPGCTMLEISLHNTFVFAPFSYSQLNALGNFSDIYEIYDNTNFSLTVTLVVTLRKFFSLLVSVIYFKTYWGLYHWIGTVLGYKLFLIIFSIKNPFVQTKFL